MCDPLAACSWPPLAPRHAAALRGAVAFVLAEVEAVGVVASGTIVRGRPHAASDLDLYVIHEAPLRRRVQRYFGERVPVEIFINPPAAVRAYFAAEHEAGRPATAHMLATGHVVLARHPVVDDLRREAARWLARPSPPGASALLRARYDAATRLEDAVDLVPDDPASASMLLGRAVTAMLETWCRTRLGTIPRGKDLLAEVAALDPQLGAAAREAFSDGPLARRLAAAEQVADRTVGARGFFEWDSGAEPVPERSASAQATMRDRDPVEVEVRPFAPTDADAVSQLVATTMRRSNARDYPLARLAPLIAYFTPDRLRQLAVERHCLVAVSGGRPIGTAALDGDQLATFFVDPDHQRRGVGTRLLAALEDAAQREGLAAVHVAASVTGATFYERHGYARTGAVHDGTAGPQIELVKRLRAPSDPERR